MMSTTRLTSQRDQTTATTSSPTPPPFVLTGKTLPVQAKLTTSHASPANPQNVFPLGDLHRQASPIEAKTYRNSRSDRGMEVGSGGGSGSVESAATLLQSLKEDDDYLVQKKRRSLALSQSASSPTVVLGRGSSAENSPVNKRYVKMGILTPESPAEVSTYRSHQLNNGNSRTTGLASSVSPSSTPPPPLSGVLTQSIGRGTSSNRHQVAGQGSTPPNQQSSAVDSQEDFLLVHHDSPSSSYRLEGTHRPYLQEEVRPPSMDNGGGDEIKVEGYEVIDLKDVSTVVDSAAREFVMVPAQQNVQPSPPISMKSESVSVHSEESTSSPDSGYGNTPEYPNANATSGGEAKSVGETSQQNGRGRDLHQESKLRADSDGGFDNTCNVANGGNNPPLTPSQPAGKEGEGGDLLTRPSTGSSSSAVVSDCSSNGQRSRGGTNESLFSVESIISSPPVQSTEGGATPGRTGDTQQQVVVEKQQTKMYLGRQSSLPPSVSGNVKSSTTPRSQSSSAGPFPFHMSPSSGSLSYSTRSPNWFGHQSTVANPSGFSELHPSHPSHPSQPHTAAAGGGGGMPSSQSYHNIYRQVKHSPESGKKRFRSGSLAFNRTAGMYSEGYSYGIVIKSCSFAAVGQCFESQSLTG